MANIEKKARGTSGVITTALVWKSIFADSPRDKAIPVASLN